MPFCKFINFSIIYKYTIFYPLNGKNIAKGITKKCCKTDHSHRLAALLHNETKYLAEYLIIILIKQVWVPYFQYDYLINPTCLLIISYCSSFSLIVDYFSFFKRGCFLLYRWIQSVVQTLLPGSSSVSGFESPLSSYDLFTSVAATTALPAGEYAVDCSKLFSFTFCVFFFSLSFSDDHTYTRFLTNSYSIFPSHTGFWSFHHLIFFLGG